MDILPSEATSAPAHAVSQPVAGVVAGLVGGAAYLVAQVSFTGLAGSGGAAPLQRIAAMLMGPDTAPPPTGLNFTVFGMAMIVHFSLAMAYGRLIGALVWRRRHGAATLVGAAIGLALFALNFGWIAPLAFPWFSESLVPVTIANHLLFGALTAAVCVALRDRGAPRRS
ncbi:hypothetical protein H8N03_20965 [Ramlibacter sp. USB13]|uniref:Uncharacterized protein n=1 Tax=Ramlibacter cellulosilyticus TaxID=2764187 RepID=A0A923MTA3_9BURK|nr:hypothetical protein [Ramlibacter cellulosilyticus]MBC5785432.1 hypothetical protein [Ramlibacter cellulosilyticus]